MKTLDAFPDNVLARKKRKSKWPEELFAGKVIRLEVGKDFEEKKTNSTIQGLRIRANKLGKGLTVKRGENGDIFFQATKEVRAKKKAAAPKKVAKKTTKRKGKAPF